MADECETITKVLDAYEREGSYFGAVRVVIAGEEAAFEFGLDERGYYSLKRILQAHPFETLGQYRYFFTGNFSKSEAASDTVTFGVRIEQGANGKGFHFDGPASVVSNLLWFQSLKDLQPTAPLKRLS